MFSHVKQQSFKLEIVWYAQEHGIKAAGENFV
jgi:hypothetical protein